ncbi:hypothetical protein HAZT_HAZT008541 [Hyalella azteca]|uniref:Fido domain-containing protein n=1 Tax=Hyalella azteca TaxID=294128 RepID=A0A6A0HCY7_HYAAZ|nr:hypothetical protein HAZT_HAZT008541 [Hyalella azteca]
MVFVGPHLPPAPPRLEELMHQFVSWLNDPASLALHPVRQFDDYGYRYAALAHYQLVYIHPFVDGNGRTARLLMNFLLMQVPGVIYMAWRVRATLPSSSATRTASSTTTHSRLPTRATRAPSCASSRTARRRRLMFTCGRRATPPEPSTRTPSLPYAPSRRSPVHPACLMISRTAGKCLTHRRM